MSELVELGANESIGPDILYHRRIVRRNIPLKDFRRTSARLALDIYQVLYRYRHRFGVFGRLLERHLGVKSKIRAYLRIFFFPAANDGFDQIR